MVVGFIEASLVAETTFLRQACQVQTGHTVITQPRQQGIRFRQIAVVGNPRIPGSLRGNLHGRDNHPGFRSEFPAEIGKSAVIDGDFPLILPKAHIKIAGVQVAQPVFHQVKAVQLPLAHGLLEQTVGFNHGVFQKHIVFCERLRVKQGFSEVAGSKHEPCRQQQEPSNFRFPFQNHIHRIPQKLK